jgi:hypothetical protein
MHWIVTVALAILASIFIKWWAGILLFFVAYKIFQWLE